MIQPTKVFLGVFDVLGFSDRVAAERLTVIASEYRRFIEVKRHSATIPLIGPSSAAGKRLIDVNSTIFSDTILMWKNASGAGAGDDLLVAASQLVASALEIGFPVRGGLSYGEAILDSDEGVFLGMPIVAAHRLENSQEWIGVAIDASFENALPASYRSTSDELVTYAIPLKASPSASANMSVKWPLRIHAAEERIIKLMQRVRSPARVKYENTLKFVRHVCS